MITYYFGCDLVFIGALDHQIWLNGNKKSSTILLNNPL